MSSKYFEYTVYNQTNLTVNQNIYIGLNNALKRWENIITIFPLKNKMKINLYLQNLEGNLLGYATPVRVIGSEFGSMFTTTSTVALNLNYLSKINYNISVIYYTILHEFGHALGIGTFWQIQSAPVKYYLENDNVYKKYYTGKNALEYYKLYFNNNNYIGIPIENDGGQGTSNGHPEEGDLFINDVHVSQDNRYINNLKYPPLKEELMTGWMDIPAPLSKITIGFLEDIGFGVNYQDSDVYNPLNIELNFPTIKQNTWELPDNNSYSSNEFKQLIKLPEVDNKNIKILIIDSGFNENKLREKGIQINSSNYKNFTGYTFGNDRIGGTDSFLTIYEFAKEASYYFAESEWTNTETIKEIDNLINAIKWGKENNVDIINISVAYSFNTGDMYYKKNELEELINTMPNTLFICAGYNRYQNLILLPGDVEKVINIGTTEGFTNVVSNFKPIFSVPNITSQSFDDGWNNLSGSFKAVCIFTGILASCLSLRPNIDKNDIIKYLKETSTLSDNYYKFYGYGIPQIDKFLEVTNKYSLINHILNINQGWNLISFSLTDINLSSIKQNTNITMIKNNIYSYNSELSDIFNNLKSIDINSGYWLYSKEDTTLNLSGYSNTSVTFNLNSGWNLISCPFYQNVSILDKLLPEILEIKNISESYNSEIPQFSNLKELKPFVGYYVKASQNITWKINAN